MFKRISLYLFSFVCIFSIKAQEHSLEYYINQGISNSPLLKDYQNQIKSNVVDSLLIKAGQKPKVDATGQILIPPYGKYFGYDEAITNGGNYQAFIGVTQNFFMKKIMANQYEGVGLQNKSVANNSKITEQELKKLITEQYITAYTSYNEIKFEKEILSLMIDEDQVLKQLAEKGVYKQTDYVSFIIEKQTQETAIMQEKLQYKQDVYDLNFICGINDTTTYILPEPNISKGNINTYDKTPVFQKFIIDSLITLNSLKSVGLKYRPTLGWFADAGFLTADPLKTYEHFGFSVGLNFTMPVYDGKQKQLQLQKIEVNDNSRKYYEDFYKKQYTQKEIQLNEKIASYDALAEQIKKQLNSIETLIKMNKAQLNTGDLSIEEHIQTIKNYIETKHQLNSLQLEKLEMINELNYISF